MSRLGLIRFRLKSAIIERFFTYGVDQLRSAVSDLGVNLGDNLMVHCSLTPSSGFRGKPVDFIKVLKDAVGKDGLLIMPSMTYTDSSRAFLQRQEDMRVRRSPSRMGFVSEIFRRGKDVRRSINATHPLLAWGSRSDWFIAGHERTDRSFGAQSPFAKLLECNGKVMVINCPLQTITFMHFVEDRFEDSIPFPLYDPQPLPGVVITNTDERIVIPTKVLSDSSRQYRREERFWKLAEKNGLVKKKRIWNTTLCLLECQALVELAEEMATSSPLYFDTPEPS